MTRSLTLPVSAALTRAFVILLAAVLVAACGAGAGADADRAASALDAEEQAESGPLPEPQTVPVGATIWHAGFELEVSQATLAATASEFDQPTYLLSVDATFTNRGPRQTGFRSQAAVVAGATSYLPSWDSDVPEVPSGLGAAGTLVYEVDESFDLASAALVVGVDENNQARIPLGPQGGELVTLEPTVPPVTGAISMELIDVTITSAQLRADVPHRYEEVEAGKLALTLDLTVTSRRSGNSSISASHFALILPDGNAVGVEGSELGYVLGSSSGIDTPDLYLRFLVTDPPAGEYTLRLTPPSSFVGDDGSDEGEVSFTLD